VLDELLLLEVLLEEAAVPLLDEAVLELEDAPESELLLPELAASLLAASLLAASFLVEP
jgi:hypothetical protein